MILKKFFPGFIVITLVIISFVIFYNFNINIKGYLYTVYSKVPFQGGIPEAVNIQQLAKKVEKNYGEEIDKYSKEFNLPPEYLKSLIILECSGHKPAPSRFEEHVYNSLLDLRSGNIENYGFMKQKDISDATDAALVNLASSWGPFQLMGYKCIQLGISLNEIRGENAVYWGIKWIDITYGNYLRNNDFENAFHIHNTGREYPLDGKATTSNPDYVRKGLKYINYF